jgi:hypothetical protein
MEFTNGDYTYDQPVNTVSPGALRRPNFGFTNLDGTSSFSASASATHSATSSNVASPVAGLRPLADDMLMMHDSMVSPQSLSGAFGNLGSDNNMLSNLDFMSDQGLSNNLAAAMDSLFDGSSRHSLTSSFNDAASASGFSVFRDGASGYYSDSGVVPEDTSMEGFLDFSGGEGGQLAQPAFGSPSSSSQIPFDLDLGHSPMSQGMSPGYPYSHALGMGGMSGMGLGHGTGASDSEAQAQIQDILSSFQQRRDDPSGSPTSMLNHSPPATFNVPTASTAHNFGHNQNGGQSLESQTQAMLTPNPLAMPLNIPPQPVVSHVIPSEGPMAGGTQVAVAGQRFAPGMTIMFGSRVAKTTVVSESFCTCELPPAAEPGLVEVGVQGAVRRVGEKVETFRYLGMDREM